MLFGANWCKIDGSRGNQIQVVVIGRLVVDTDDADEI